MRIYLREVIELAHAEAGDAFGLRAVAGIGGRGQRVVERGVSSSCVLV